MMLPAGLLPLRLLDSHKGDFGRVVVVAGSPGLTGAAALSANGALRAGAGLVTLATPRSLQPIFETKLTEAMTRGLSETKEQSLAVEALPELLELVERADAVAVGPGLSQHAQTKQLIKRLVPKITKPCVLDADGLNAVADDTKLLKRLVHPMIVTPHPGEMGRLIRLSAEEVQRDRQRITVEFAKHHGVIVVLKGHRTLVANVDGELFINDTGNPGMAAGGMGDVLAGVIAGLLGQRLAPFDAARLGVYLHGLAGDLVAERLGRVGLIASDLLDTIPLAIRRYQGV